MKHPLASLSNSARKPAFLALSAWTVILIAISQVINAPLRNPAAPTSIVSFELARTASNAQAIVSSWDPSVQLFVAFGLGFDYLFMPSYALAIALACLLAASRHKGWFANIGAWLGWGVFMAAFFDAIENIGLWRSLIGPVGDLWPAISFWCATFKFAFILLGIAYGLIGWILPKKSW